jgi:putative ATP-dependent endonuclease of OLD family
MCAEVRTESSLEGIALKAVNIKCFGDNPAGFDAIKPINIAIGRNNSGKSTLLDVVEWANRSKSITLRGHLGHEPEVIVEIPLSIDLRKKIPGRQSSVRVSQDRELQIDLAGWSRGALENVRVVQCRQLATGKLEPLRFVGYIPTGSDEKAIYQRVLSIVGNELTGPFGNFSFRRLSADRDVLPESRDNNIGIGQGGIGFTNAIRTLLTVNNKDSDLVEKTFLEHLNEILRPDSEFSRILIRENLVESNPQGPWEIHLQEEKKGRSIPLSQTGSGLKTVMLVLGNMLIMPRIDNRPLSEYIFAFEELENNLHPAAQRRLLRYLRMHAEESSCYFFLTTHSNVVIDLFANDPLSQILHVSHDGITAEVNRFTSSSVGWRILDDLDVRASDLLQSNAVIWVEGPSDRIYVDKWIDVWSKGSLQSGVHYQCLSYGGAIRKHLSMEEPDVARDMTVALTINRHAIFLADSDKAKEGDSLNKEVIRLIKEAADVGGFGFATKGKTIENYIPVDAWRIVAGDDSLRGPSQFTDGIEYAREKITPKPTKVELAKKTVPHLTREMLEATLDLGTRLDQICTQIQKWN